MKQVKEIPGFVKTMVEADLPFPGVHGWMLQGEKQQAVVIEFTETVDVPEHAHDEQWEFVIAGTALLKREGTEQEYGPGENFFIPAGQPHAARVNAGYRALILFNAPDRYTAKG